MAISRGDGSIVLTTEVDQTGLKRGINSMQSGVKSLTGAFGKLAAAIGVAFSVSAIVNFSKESSKMASNTEASVQRLIDIYGEASQAVGDFIDANANALGMSKASAAQFASVYGNLFSVWADQAANAKLTNQYLQATAVVATKTGRTMEDVQERIRSGLLGNTEAVEDLGIFVNVKTIEMTEAFQRVADGRSWEKLSAYEQSQVRTLAILEQATKKYGNEVATTTSLTRARFNAAFEDFKNTWGIVVNNVLMPVLEVLTKVFEYATKALQTVFKISGKTINYKPQTDAIDSAVKSQNNLTDAIEETEEAQKESLLAFDELNILETPEEKGTGGVGSVDDLLGDTGNIQSGIEEIKDDGFSAFDGIIERLKEISEIVSDGFWDGFKNTDFSGIKEDLKSISLNVQDISVDANVQEAAKNFIQTFSYEIGRVAGSIVSVGKTIGKNIIGGFDYFLQDNKEQIKSDLVSAFNISSEIMTTIGDLTSSIAYIFSAFSSEAGQQLTGSLMGIAYTITTQVPLLFGKIGSSIMNAIVTPIESNKGRFKIALGSIIEIAGSVAESVRNVLGNVFSGLNELWDTGLAPIVSTLGETLSGMFGGLLDGLNTSIFPAFKDAFSKIGNALSEAFGPAIQNLLSAFGNLLSSLQPIFSAIGQLASAAFGVIVDVASSVISPVISILGDLASGIINAFSTIIDGVAQMINGLAEVFSSVFEGDIKGIFEGLVDTIKGFFEATLGWVYDIVYSVVEAIKSLWDGIKGIFETFADIGQSITGIGVEHGGRGGSYAVEASYVSEASIPALAKGAVIPPNKEFLAVLGDQKSGTNIEAPIDTIKQAFRDELNSMGGMQTETVTNINFTGNLAQLARVLKPQIERETLRQGTKLITGGAY